MEVLVDVTHVDTGPQGGQTPWEWGVCKTDLNESTGDSGPNRLVGEEGEVHEVQVRTETLWKSTTGDLKTPVGWRSGDRHRDWRSGLRPDKRTSSGTTPSR